MKVNIQSILHRRNAPSIARLFLVVFSVILFSLIIFQIKRLSTGDDDQVLRDAAMNYSYVDWIVYRYQSWSGRTGADTFVYLISHTPLYVWQILSVLFYLIFTVYIYRYYVLFIPTPNKYDKFILLLLSSTLLYTFEVGAVVDGVFWVTGAMNYFWVATLALVSLYPLVLYATRNKRVSWFEAYIAFILGFVAAGSQEQVGLVLVSLTLLIFIQLTILHKKVLKFPLAWLSVVSTAFIVSYLSPGNDLRLEKELERIPDFYSTPLAERAEYSYRWLMDAFVNHTGLLLFGIMCMLVIGLLINKKINEWKIILIIILSIGLSAFVFSHTNTFGFLTNFNSGWGMTDYSYGTYIALVCWSIILISIVASFLFTIKDKKTAFFCISLFTLAIGSTLAIATSPTMYASGVRVMFIPSILLAAVFIITAVNILYDMKLAWRATMLIVVIYGFLSYLWLLHSYLDGYLIHLQWQSNLGEWL